MPSMATTLDTSKRPSTSAPSSSTLRTGRRALGLPARRPRRDRRIERVRVHVRARTAASSVGERRRRARRRAAAPRTRDNQLRPRRRQAAIARTRRTSQAQVRAARGRDGLRARNRIHAKRIEVVLIAREFVAGEPECRARLAGAADDINGRVRSRCMQRGGGSVGSNKIIAAGTRRPLPLFLSSCERDRAAVRFLSSSFASLSHRSPGDPGRVGNYARQSLHREDAREIYPTTHPLRRPTACAHRRVLATATPRMLAAWQPLILSKARARLGPRGGQHLIQRGAGGGDHPRPQARGLGARSAHRPVRGGAALKSERDRPVRARFPGEWHFPAGARRQADRGPLQTACREFHEPASAARRAGRPPRRPS